MAGTGRTTTVQSEPMDSPANRIGVALSGLALSMRLSGAVRRGQIDVTIYHHPVVIDTGSTTQLHLPAYPDATKADLLAGIDNMVLLAVSGSALTTDEVLSHVFGPFDPASPDDMTAIRMMVSQVRNAFAHRPWQPSWNIRPAQRGVFPVVLADTRFDFDTRDLHGKRLKPEDFGGTEFWVRLLQHCQNIVAG
jgi:hypothetical protein